MIVTFFCSVVECRKPRGLRQNLTSDASTSLVAMADVDAIAGGECVGGCD